MAIRELVIVLGLVVSFVKSDSRGGQGCLLLGTDILCSPLLKSQDQDLLDSKLHVIVTISKIEGYI